MPSCILALNTVTVPTISYSSLSAVVRGPGLVPILDLHADEGTVGPVLVPDQDPVPVRDPVTGGPVPTRVDLGTTGHALGHVIGGNHALAQGPAIAPAKRSPWMTGRAAPSQGQLQPVLNAPEIPIPVHLLPRRIMWVALRMESRIHQMPLTKTTNCTDAQHQKTISFHTLIDIPLFEQRMVW